MSQSVSIPSSAFTVDTSTGQTRWRATRTYTALIQDDTVDETDETFTVTLAFDDPSAPYLVAGDLTATITIEDNDHVAVTLGWEETELTAEEPTSVGATKPVVLRAMAVTSTDKRPDSGFTFDFTASTVNGTARQPDDYEQLSSTETFDRSDFSRITVDGQSRWVASRNFTVDVEHDTVDEPAGDVHRQAGLRWRQPAVPAPGQRDGDRDHHGRRCVPFGPAHNGDRRPEHCRAGGPNHLRLVGRQQRAGGYHRYDAHRDAGPGRDLCLG